MYVHHFPQDAAEDCDVHLEGLLFWPQYGQAFHVWR